MVTIVYHGKYTTNPNRKKNIGEKIVKELSKDIKILPFVWQWVNVVFMFIYLCIMLSNTISASDDVRVFNNDKSGVTSGALTENLPGNLSTLPICFRWGRVAQSIVLCVFFYGIFFFQLLIFLFFGHCIVCHSNYPFGNFKLCVPMV